MQSIIVPRKKTSLMYLKYKFFLVGISFKDGHCAYAPGNETKEEEGRRKMTRQRMFQTCIGNRYQGKRCPLQYSYVRRECPTER